MIFNTSNLENIISQFNCKFGFDLEAAEYTSNIIFEYELEFDSIVKELSKFQESLDLLQKKENKTKADEDEIAKIVAKISELSVNKSHFKLSPGSKDGEIKGTGHHAIYWDSKNKIWLPKDLFNSTRSGRDFMFKPMSLEDKEILLDAVKEIKGKINAQDLIGELQPLFKELYKDIGSVSILEKEIGSLEKKKYIIEKEISNLEQKKKELKKEKFDIDKKRKDLKKEDESQLEEINKNISKIEKDINKIDIDISKEEKPISGINDSISKIKKDLAKIEEPMHDLLESIKKSSKEFISSKSEALKSRENALSKIDNTFGTDLGQLVKKVILRVDSPSDIISTIDKSIQNKSDVEYEPKFDENKDEFNKKDIKYILDLIKKNHKDGVPGIIKKLLGKYNKNLLEDLQDASAKYGDIDGIFTYLNDYEEKKKEVDRWQRSEPEKKPGKEMPEVASVLKPVEDFIKKLKDSIDMVNYEDSFLFYTEKFIKAIKSYSRHNKKMPEFEIALADVLGGFDSEKGEGLIKAWKDAKVPELTKIMSELPKKLSDSLDVQEHSFVKEKDPEQHMKNMNKFYDKMEQMESKPSFVKDLIDLKNKPIKFQPIEFEDSEGNPIYIEDLTLKDQKKLLKDKTTLNFEDKEFIENIKQIMKKDKKKELKELSEEGLTEKEIKERSRRFKQIIKDEKKENLLKTLSDKDQEDYFKNEQRLKAQKDKLKSLKKQLKSLQSKDEENISKEISDLEKTIEKEKDPTKKDKLYDKVENLQKKLKQVINLSKKDKEDLKKDIESSKSLINQTKNLLEESEDKMAVFKDLDSWLKKINEDIKEKSKLKSKDVDLEEISDSEKKDLVEKFSTAALVSYLEEFPEILNKYEPIPEIASKIDKLEESLEKLEDKKDKTEEDNKNITELKSEIDKLNTRNVRLIKRDKEDSIQVVKEIKKRLTDIYSKMVYEATIKGEDKPKIRYVLDEKAFSEHYDKMKLKDDKLKKILEEAGIKFKKLLKDNIEDIREKVLDEEGDTGIKKSNIINLYKKSSLYKLEKLAQESPHSLIKIELLGIIKELKGLI